MVAKSEAAELGTGPRIGELDRFIEEEFALASDAGSTPGVRDPDLLEDANRVFREIVNSEP